MATTDPASVLQRILAFFRGKGLSDAQSAGIAANFQIESGYRTDAYNAGENAIGLAQWQGGRRIALQRFAAQRGTTETDLDTQLAFAWQELTGGYAGVYQQLLGTHDPAAAAALIDARYEVSSGAARGARESAARTIYSQLQTGQLSPGDVVLGGAGPQYAAGGTAQANAAGYNLPGGIANPLNWFLGAMSIGQNIGNLVIKSVITAGGLGLVVVGMARASAPVASSLAQMTPAGALAGAAK